MERPALADVRHARPTSPRSRPCRWPTAACPRRTYALLVRAAHAVARPGRGLRPARRASAGSSRPGATYARAARRRAPLRQPAARAGRAPHRRGRPAGPQLRRADHRNPGRAAGRASRPRSTARCRRRTSASCCAAREPACSSRPGPELAPATWETARELAADGRLDTVLVVRPTAADRAHPSRCRSCPGSRVGYLDAARRSSRPVPLRRHRPRSSDLAALSTPAAPPARRSWPRTPTPWRSPTPGCWPPTAGFTPESAVFAALPLFHVNALVVTLLMPLFKGQQVRVGRAAGLPRPRACTRGSGSWSSTTASPR